MTKIKPYTIMDKSIFQYGLHFIPELALLAILIAFYRDPFIGLWLVLVLRWLVLGLILWLFIALGRIWKTRGAHKIIFFGLLAIDILVLLLLLLVRIPGYKCDPDEMVRHYEAERAEMEALVAFTRSAMDEGQSLFLEFDHEKVVFFRTSKEDVKRYDEDEDEDHVSATRTQELMSGIGLDDEEFRRIKESLKQIKCISIETHYPEYCDIGYKRVALGGYYFRLYLNPMTDEQKQNALSCADLIPYNDTMVMMYAGGAAGPQVFPYEVKQDFLERHPEIVGA